MSDSTIEYGDRLPVGNVALYDVRDDWQARALRARARDLYLDHTLVVVDGVDWGEALGIIQREGLDARRRAFKEPYIERTPTPAVKDAVAAMLAQAALLYAELFPWEASVAHSSFRPMITGPEPLHYDSYGGQHPLVTAYINVSDEPRVYGISWTFAQLAARERVYLRRLMPRAKDGDLAHALRMDTQAGRGPLGPGAPRHRVELAPGAIWFFNAKTVSHEVIFGRGAVGIGWEVPTSGARLQPQIISEAFA